MQAAVRRHDEVMRTAIAEHGGQVFKTIGDAFCAAFARPEDAVAAMLDAQRALAPKTSRPSTGFASEQRFIPAPPTSATATTSDRPSIAWRGCSPSGTAVRCSSRVSRPTSCKVRSRRRQRLRDLGEHRLRDLARPEQVYQLLAPDLIADFPPLRSLDVLPNNLPLQLKSFVGRETEIAEITRAHRDAPARDARRLGRCRQDAHIAASRGQSARRLRRRRLVYRTRAAYRAASISPQPSPRPSVSRLPPEGDPVENLVRALKSKHVLLVFDNCEHMVEPAARVISAILQGCPEVRILASSRQGLGY